ncbi:class I SAM-dependent methyltransferase [Methylobacterium mesophilicum SR1.6/6]|uniref:Class I SAM-dependent methyltransferase n=1 Tax=Methylobacterium mesophilicum SR1.6/6 TaxID=908290 RepID=A0A6B9FLM6_9HYPH|nr:SAM-dependent methyltransferase [Methylobacterium mesophilicum]QGY02626.1 class I SAM-dependent methyltransferase [Methylobacterium mesophilicum SR1.6/6]
MTPLGAEIAALIRQTGPIGVDRYMALCLGHPVHGYYRTRDPLGVRGDFTTAPEISQMFGELIGAWSGYVHGLMGRPDPLVLVELGPGRGTLMADALRALRAAAPGVRVAPHLVETSPVLRAAQERALAGTGAIWHAEVETLPPGPSVVVANEFFDCLPVRQFERRPTGWHERQVGLGPAGGLAFGLSPEPTPGLEAAGPVGALMSVPTAGLALIRGLSQRLCAAGGALLAIDYGHVRPGFGDTLQALSGHSYADPLAAPGQADLTHHVDFAALAQAARVEGADVHGPVEQRDFLFALGLLARAERLQSRATEAQAPEIGRATARLTEPGVRGMGSLFKVLAVSGPGLGPLPGFPNT